MSSTCMQFVLRRNPVFSLTLIDQFLLSVTGLPNDKPTRLASAGSDDGAGVQMTVA